MYDIGMLIADIKIIFTRSARTIDIIKYIIMSYAFMIIFIALHFSKFVFTHTRLLLHYYAAVEMVIK